MSKDVGFVFRADTKQSVEAIKQYKKATREAKNETLDLGTVIKNVFSQNTSIIGFVKSIGKITEGMMKAAEAEAEYVESMNLLAVSYRADTEEGEKLYNTTNKLLDSMSEILGLDPASLTQQVGIYKQMTSAMGMTNQESALLSENLIKLQQDTASLYNLQSSEVATKFQSALAGQTRAVRSLGVDITQASLQQELYNLGINKSFNELNRASKTTLIYIAMQRQLANANGDASRTINSVANQMKIFKEQVKMAARQIGAIFIPVLKAILPIANAILMVFNDIMKIILGLFGVDVQSMAQEFGQKSVDIGDNFIDMSDNIDEATKSAKKLLGLRGFDKLNNITTPSDSGSSSNSGISGGGVGGVDSKLLGALDEYNLHLDETINKAREIANWIEKWIIYTDEAGNKHLTWLGKIAALIGVGGIIYKGVKIVWGVVSTINKITGGKMFPLITKIGTKLGAIAKAIGSLGLGPVLAIIIGIVDYIGKIPHFFEMITSTIDRIKNGENIFEAMFPQNSEELIERIFYILPLTGILKLIDEASGHKLNIDANIELVAEKLDQVKEWFKNTKDWIYNNIIKKVVDFIVDIATTIYNKVIQPTIENISYIFNIISTFVTNFYNDIISPVVNYISHLFSVIFEGIANVASNIWEVIKGIATRIWDIMKKVAEVAAKIIEIFIALGAAAYNHIIKPIIDYIVKAYQFVWNKIIKPVIETLGKAASWFYNNVIKPVVNFFGDVGTWVYNHIIKPVWDKFWWLKNKILDIFSGVWQAVADFGMGVIKSVINGIFSSIETSINFFIKALNKAIDLINKIPDVNISRVQELKITRLADGGFVDEGQMFIAREAGPEMVGTINGRTAVANNDQIVKGITDGVMIGVARAMQQSGGTQKIVIEADGDTEGLLNFITFKQKENERQYGM